MQMKEHILTALKEQLASWEELLTHFSEEDIIKPQFDLDWSIKDVLVHLWGWQQISIARVEAGLKNQEPEYPQWIVNQIENWEDDSNQVNALFYELHHDKSWAEVYQNWQNGYLQMIELGSQISERDLLDSDRYPWLHGYSLIDVLISSYAHHQEHWEKLSIL